VCPKRARFANKLRVSVPVQVDSAVGVSVSVGVGVGIGFRVGFSVGVPVSVPVGARGNGVPDTPSLQEAAPRTPR
jgi:hypothetical protein